MSLSEKTKADALRKIKACLDLAASSNATEAETAWRQAQGLMQKYNLDMVDVNADRASACRSKATVKKMPADWEMTLAQTVEKAMACKAIFSRGLGDKAWWVWVGTGINPELADYAFVVLLKQLRKDREDYKKTGLSRVRKLSTKRNRLMSFSEAWASAVYYKVQRLAVSALDKEAIDAYLAKNHSHLGSLTGRSADEKKATDNDRYQGHSKGKAANLSRPVGGDVNATKRLGAV